MLEIFKECPTCPNCGEELVIQASVDITYVFNKDTGRYDLCEINGISGDMCRNCGESPWTAWEEDESTNMFERMTEHTPPSKFRALF